MRLKKTLSVASTVCLIALGYAVITYGQQIHRQRFTTRTHLGSFPPIWIRR